jgi:hypothetical protein
MKTTIKAKKDLYNYGRCFTKGQTYEVEQQVTNTAGLMECLITNDLGQPHRIGSWWRDFIIVN